jgi:hypothetical protein
VKSKVEYYESSHWCKHCSIINHKKWLANNPNAQIADKLRRQNSEKFTGLPLNVYNMWLNFTKRFCGEGKLEIDHLYPLSKYDLTNDDNIKHCLNWKHVRYMTKVQNIKKGCKMPTALDKFKQIVMVCMFKRNVLDKL